MTGAIVTAIGSHLAALFFGWNDIYQVDDKLLAPFVVKMLRRRLYHSVQVVESVPMKQQLSEKN